MIEFKTKSKIIEGLQCKVFLLEQHATSLHCLYADTMRKLENVEKENKELRKQYNALRKKHECLVWSLKK